ncbi:MAG: hypothetical protein IKW21_01445 [Lachnospiraceae bacterium]|nr:hypothetical protein [Lachnospiraceae bacterium]
MELFRLLGTIAVENDAAIKGINETTGEAEKAESKMSKAFEKVGAVAVKVAKAGAIAAATAVATTTTMAVKAYAEYEQLTGGVQTLFKDSSDKLIEYANNAYKTAGLSANEYMETVTSFSASLLQSLGGDTEKAADYADMAITDMSDNANKMGTSMEMIQNAYQGFAKQNYTMLDNLKLGYGGTQEEMKRLLADAEAISGIKYDISSYADVVDAIHVIQTEMGITGTTAKEASETISGSIAAAKGAWQNFLVGLADGTQNMDVLVENLVSSVVTVGKNLIPRIATTLKSIGTLIAKHVPKMLAEVPKQLGKLGGEIENKLPELMKIGLDAIVKLSEKIKAKSPAFLQAGLDFIIKIAKGLVDSLPVLIEKIPILISNMADSMKANSSKFLPAAAELARTLGIGLLKAIPALIKNIPKIIAAIVKTLTSFAWGLVGKGLITTIADGFKASISIVKAVANKAKDAILQPIQTARDKVKAIVDKIKGFFNFKVSLPKIKLPHFSIKPSGWKIGDLLKGIKPELGIEWYAKGAIFDKPTLFATPHGMKGVGEAGAEAVAPISTLQAYVSEAVATQNEAVVYYLQKMTEIMADYFPQVVTGLDRPISIDADGMASAMAVPMDKYLGRIKERKDRGR